MSTLLPPAEALPLIDLVTPTPRGIASRVLVKAGAGNVTLFAFDAGQGLTEHTSPYDAWIIVLEGELALTIGGAPVRAAEGTITHLPANVPHAVDAVGASRLLLLMLRSEAA